MYTAYERRDATGGMRVIVLTDTCSHRPQSGWYTVSDTREGALKSPGADAAGLVCGGATRHPIAHHIGRVTTLFAIQPRIIVYTELLDNSKRRRSAKLIRLRVVRFGSAA